MIIKERAYEMKFYIIEDWEMRGENYETKKKRFTKSNQRKSNKKNNRSRKL